MPYPPGPMDYAPIGHRGNIAQVTKGCQSGGVAILPVKGHK